MNKSLFKDVISAFVVVIFFFNFFSKSTHSAVEIFQRFPQIFILCIFLLISNLSSIAWKAYKSRRSSAGSENTYQWNNEDRDSNSSYRSSQDAGAGNSYHGNDSDSGSNWSYSGSQSNSSNDYSYTSNEELQTAYSILGISSSTSDADAKKAYLMLMRRYHPDRVRSLSEAERIRAKEMSQKINAAWEKVKKFRDI